MTKSVVAGGPQGKSSKEGVPQGQSQERTFLLQLDRVEANKKVMATKAVSGKDAGCNDPEDGTIKEAITSSKGVSLGKFGHCIAVKAVVKVKDEVTNSSKWMKGNGGDAIATKAMTPVQHW